MNEKINLNKKFQINNLVYGLQFSVLTVLVASNICWLYLLQRVQQVEKHHCRGI